MQFDTFVRKPFTVEAVEVTRENMHEISMLIEGELIEEDGEDPFIRVNSRKTPNLHKVKLGAWLSKMGEKYRVYSKEVFMSGFEPTDYAQMESWSEREAGT